MFQVKIEPLAANMTVLTKGYVGKTKKILFSYETPVSVLTEENDFLVTSTFYSKTTKSHITKWLRMVCKAKEVQLEPIKVPQSAINKLAGYYNDED